VDLNTSLGFCRRSDVDIWIIQLEQDDEQVSCLEPVVSADERERAQRFVFAHDRRRYVVAHGMLRRILGRYIGLQPDSISFRVGPYGKPCLTESETVRFNLTHSGVLGMVAITTGREVGADVEQIRPELADLSVARRFFASAEVAALASLEGVARVRAFFACWTRKEAYIKALGLGLSLDLGSFAVTVAHDEPPRLLSANGGASEIARWQFHTIDAAPGYAATVAVERGPGQLRLWRCHDISLPDSPAAPALGSA
jgi:4'-phosphopantetheinyl transferase